MVLRRLFSHMKSSSRLPALLLSIHPEHAERIFSGAKLFELRKVLPTGRFGRVYLYESGGAGIIGWFQSGRVIRKPLRQLWADVGDRATTRRRFFAYFSGWQVGCAVRILRPRRFSIPLYPQELKDKVPEFTAPMSYLLVLRTEPLFRILERRSKEEQSRPRIQLRRIRNNEHARYEALVTKEIGARYDEITGSFAKSILTCHRRGIDKNGIFTLGKEIFAICRGSRLLGFTTVTYKVGGSVKTGPTIILSRYRRKGYGLAARLALAERLRRSGVRKMYCTCPDSDRRVINHLLGSGYRIEAHLHSHYTIRHGELVFGKFLKGGQRVSAVHRKLRRTPGYRVDPTSVGSNALAQLLNDALSANWGRLPLRAARRIVEMARRPRTGVYEEKEVNLVCVGDKKRCNGAIVLIPKRGGSAKGLCLPATKHLPTIDRLIGAAEDEARATGRRKLYFLHPMLDHRTIRALRQRGYAAEGVLR